MSIRGCVHRHLHADVFVFLVATQYHTRKQYILAARSNRARSGFLSADKPRPSSRSPSSRRSARPLLRLLTGRPALKKTRVRMILPTLCRPAPPAQRRLRTLQMILSWLYIFYFRAPFMSCTGPPLRWTSSPTSTTTSYSCADAETRPRN